MTDLSGQVALVTGGATGIGRATALALAARGADVAVHYHSNETDAQAVVSEVRASGARAEAFRADLTQGAELRRVVAEAQSALGSVDILVNNAGGLVGRAALADMSEEFFHEVMNVNVLTMVLACQAVAPGMIARRRGAIVNLSSLAAHNGGGPGASVYAAAKAAVIALTKAYARELAPHGIRVNAVSPGLIGGTPFHARFTKPEAFAATIGSIPIGRAGTPDDVGRVVAFLASEDAAFLAGETIEINGGMFMR